nr:hypothetical protein HK105_000563 [Polyrhizophydium stewartii]
MAEVASRDEHAAGTAAPAPDAEQIAVVSDAVANLAQESQQLIQIFKEQVAFETANASPSAVQTPTARRLKELDAQRRTINTALLSQWSLVRTLVTLLADTLAEYVNVHLPPHLDPVEKIITSLAVSNKGTYRDYEFHLPLFLLRLVGWVKNAAAEYTDLAAGPMPAGTAAATGAHALPMAASSAVAEAHKGGGQHHHHKKTPAPPAPGMQHNAAHGHASASTGDMSRSPSTLASASDPHGASGEDPAEEAEKRKLNVRAAAKHFEKIEAEIATSAGKMKKKPGHADEASGSPEISQRSKPTLYRANTAKAPALVKSPAMQAPVLARSLATQAPVLHKIEPAAAPHYDEQEATAIRETADMTAVADAEADANPDAHAEADPDDDGRVDESDAESPVGRDSQASIVRPPGYGAASEDYRTIMRGKGSTQFAPKSASIGSLRQIAESDREEEQVPEPGNKATPLESTNTSTTTGTTTATNATTNAAQKSISASGAETAARGEPNLENLGRHVEAGIQELRAIASNTDLHLANAVPLTPNFSQQVELQLGQLLRQSTTKQSSASLSRINTARSRGGYSSASAKSSASASAHPNPVHGLMDEAGVSQMNAFSVQRTIGSPMTPVSASVIDSYFEPVGGVGGVNVLTQQQAPAVALGSIESAQGQPPRSTRSQLSGEARARQRQSMFMLADLDVTKIDVASEDAQRELLALQNEVLGGISSNDGPLPPPISAAGPAVPVPLRFSPPVVNKTTKPKQRADDGARGNLQSLKQTSERLAKDRQSMRQSLLLGDFKVFNQFAASIASRPFESLAAVGDPSTSGTDPGLYGSRDEGLVSEARKPVSPPTTLSRKQPPPPPASLPGTEITAIGKRPSAEVLSAGTQLQQQPPPPPSQAQTSSGILGTIQRNVRTVPLKSGSDLPADSAAAAQQPASKSRGDIWRSKTLRVGDADGDGTPGPKPAVQKSTKPSSRASPAAAGEHLAPASMAPSEAHSGALAPNLRGMSMFAKPITVGASLMDNLEEMLGIAHPTASVAGVPIVVDSLVEVPENSRGVNGTQENLFIANVTSAPDSVADTSSGASALSATGPSIRGISTLARLGEADQQGRDAAESGRDGARSAAAAATATQHPSMDKMRTESEDFLYIPLRMEALEAAGFGIDTSGSSQVVVARMSFQEAKAMGIPVYAPTHPRDASQTDPGAGSATAGSAEADPPATVANYAKGLNRNKVRRYDDDDDDGRDADECGNSGSAFNFTAKCPPEIPRFEAAPDVFRVLIVPLNGMIETCMLDLSTPTRFGRNNSTGHPNFRAFSTLVVSRNHMEIFEHEGKVYVKDIGSNSGTFRNHARLSPPGAVSPDVELHTGDYVQLGKDYLGEGTEYDAEGRVQSRRRCVQFQVVLVPPGRGVVECIESQGIPIETPSPLVRASRDRSDAEQHQSQLSQQSQQQQEDPLTHVRNESGASQTTAAARSPAPQRDERSAGGVMPPVSEAAASMDFLSMRSLVGDGGSEPLLVDASRNPAPASPAAAAALLSPAPASGVSPQAGSAHSISSAATRSPGARSPLEHRESFVLSAVAASGRVKKLEISSSQGANIFDINLKRWDEKGRVQIADLRPSAANGMIDIMPVSDRTKRQPVVFSKTSKLSDMTFLVSSLTGSALGTIEISSGMKMSIMRDSDSDRPDAPTVAVSGDFKEGRFIIVKKLANSREQRLFGESRGRHLVRKTVRESHWLANVDIAEGEINSLIIAAVVLIALYQ